MIKNIVFDVGNVLITWTPYKLSHALFNNEHDALICEKEVFNSPLWKEFDLGIIPDSKIMEMMEEKLDINDHHIVKETVTRFAHIVWINEEVNTWAINMKKRGFKIYLLTNYGHEFIHNLNRLPVKPYIDGYICSSDVKMVKPNLDIYRLLLNKYSLNGEECLFIDDLKVNTDAALKAGFNSVITFNGNINQLYDFSK